MGKFPLTETQLTETEMHSWNQLKTETEIGATEVALHGRERATKVNYREGRRTTGPGDYSNVSLCSDARSRPIWTLFQTSVTFPRRTERRNHAAEFSSHASIHWDQGGVRFCQPVQLLKRYIQGGPILTCGWKKIVIWWKISFASVMVGCMNVMNILRHVIMEKFNCYLPK